MKTRINLSRPMLLAFAVALSSGAGIAYAACSPDAYRICGDQAAACIARGTNEVICEYRYEQCLVTRGCGPWQ